MEQAPMAAGQSLVALDFLLAAPAEFAVVAGDDPAEFLAVLEAIYARFLPHKVVAPALSSAPSGPCAGRSRFWTIGPCSTAGRRPISASTSPAVRRSSGVAGLEEAIRLL